MFAIAARKKLLLEVLSILLLANCCGASLRHRSAMVNVKHARLLARGDNTEQWMYPCLSKDGQHCKTDGTKTISPAEKLSAPVVTGKDDQGFPVYSNVQPAQPEPYPSVYEPLSYADVSVPDEDPLPKWMQAPVLSDTHKLKIKAGGDLNIAVQDAPPIMGNVVPQMLLDLPAADLDGKESKADAKKAAEGCPPQSDGRVWSDPDSAGYDGLQSPELMIPHSSEKDPTACQKKCKSVKGCAHFTYWHVAGGLCTLQTKSAILRDSPFKDGTMDAGMQGPERNNTWGAPSCS
jgi:hypothetical protein